MLVLPAVVAIAGMAGSLIGSAMEEPWVDPQAFGSAGAWFSGSAALAALIYVVVHRADDRSGRESLHRQRIVGDTYALETLLQVDPTGEDFSVAAEVSRVIGQIGSHLGDLPVQGNANELYGQIVAASVGRSDGARQRCLDVARELRKCMSAAP